MIAKLNSNRYYNLMISLRLFLIKQKKHSKSLISLISERLYRQKIKFENPVILRGNFT